uniref:Uncharacterized protein n=1 Tax=Mycena chlorophos TaxID=658473 RepID=A0ABQ0L1X1_MYCCL|nr:predicted protein [Mycena chlorophos]
MRSWLILSLDCFPSLGVYLMVLFSQLDLSNPSVAGRLPVLLAQLLRSCDNFLLRICTDSHRPTLPGGTQDICIFATSARRTGLPPRSKSASLSLVLFDLAVAAVAPALSFATSWNTSTLLSEFANLKLDIFFSHKKFIPIVIHMQAHGSQLPTKFWPQFYWIRKLLHYLPAYKWYQYPETPSSSSSMADPDFGPNTWSNTPGMRSLTAGASLIQLASRMLLHAC